MYIAVCHYINTLPSLCAGDIRLVNGFVPTEGRVELFYEGEWGRINVAVPSLTGKSVARAACRQVGYPYSDGVDEDFGQGSGPGWAEIIFCRDEERVEQCDHRGWRYNVCPSCPDLAVRCRGMCSVYRYRSRTHWIKVSSQLNTSYLS